MCSSDGGVGNIRVNSAAPRMPAVVLLLDFVMASSVAPGGFVELGVDGA